MLRYFIFSHINWQKLWPDNFLGTWWVIFVPANLILINYSHRPSLSEEWVCRKVIVKHSIYQKLFNVWTDFNLPNFTFTEYCTWIRVHNDLIRLPRDYLSDLEKCSHRFQLHKISLKQSSQTNPGNKLVINQ